MTRPQNAGWTLKRLIPDIVTTNVTRDPRVKDLANAVTKACCRARSIAMPPKARMNSLGVASMSRVRAGARRAHAMARTPYTTAAVYWRCLLPEDVIRAF